MSSDAHEVMIVAGEASGDMHAAGMIRAVHAHNPHVRFSGIGGAQMAAAGAEIMVDAEHMAVVGLVEVLAHFPTLYSALRRMRRELRHRRPALLILVDYPDFNLRLARTARELKIPVLYYISPQIWAWRPGRVHKMRELVDRMAVVFPFEEPFYRDAGVPVKFVGHPLVGRVLSVFDRDGAVSALGLDPGRPVVGLLPGSRRSEIKHLLPTLVKAARLLQQELPDAQFVLPRAGSVPEQRLQPALQDAGVDIHVISGRTYDAMRACDVAVTASGTTTLELALLGTPMVVIYRVAAITHAILRPQLRIKHIALCNIVAGREVVPELIQTDATPAAIAAAALRLLREPGLAETQRKALAEVGRRLGDGGGAERVAGQVLEMLARTPFSE